MRWPFEADPPPIFIHFLLQKMIINPIKALHSLVITTGLQNEALKTEGKDGAPPDQW